MRIAIFSDIHGNKEALEAIIADIKKENIDEVICLGDTIGIGPNPKECMDLIIENNIKTLWGNHELYLLKGHEIDNEMPKNQISHVKWVKKQIPDYQKKYIENSSLTLEKEINGKKILFEHFLIDDNSKDEYPFHDLKLAKDGLLGDIIKDLNYDLIFIGHEHKPFIIDNKLYDVGSSGCRKDNITMYTVLNTITFEIETKTLEYNRKQFEESLLKNNYPNRNVLSDWFYGIKIK